MKMIEKLAMTASVLALFAGAGEAQAGDKLTVRVAYGEMAPGKPYQLPEVSVQSDGSRYDRIAAKNLAATFWVSGEPWRRGWSYRSGGLYVGGGSRFMSEPTPAGNRSYRVEWEAMSDRVDPVALCNQKLGEVAPRQRAAFQSMDHEYVVPNAYQVMALATWQRNAVGWTTRDVTDHEPVPLKVRCLAREGSMARHNARTSGGRTAPPARNSTQAPLSDVSLSVTGTKYRPLGGQLCPSAMIVKADFRTRKDADWNLRFYHREGAQPVVRQSDGPDNARSVEAELVATWPQQGVIVDPKTGLRLIPAAPFVQLSGLGLHRRENAAVSLRCKPQPR